MPVRNSPPPDGDIASARAAFEEGEAVLARGDLALARRWFDRAHRLAPGHDRLTLSLAMVLLRVGDDEGRALLSAVGERHDLRAVWLALAGAHRRAGDEGEAAAALARALSFHVWTRREAAGTAILDAVAAEAGYAGWCALDADGRVITGRKGVGALVLALDGKPVALLPPGWERAALLTVEAGGRALLGSPIRIAALRRTEGFVEAREGGIRGWAWHPGEPERDPVLGAGPAGATRPSFTVTASDTAISLAEAPPLARPHGFVIPAARLTGIAGLVAVRDRDGRDLAGSPLDPGLESAGAAALARAMARRLPLPGTRVRPVGKAPPFVAPQASLRISRGGKAAAGSVRTGVPVDVIVPVHGAMAVTLACLEGVERHLPTNARIVVVDDASPDPALLRALDEWARAGRMSLVRLARNRGFPASCNEGIRAARRGADILLLNSDTRVAGGWIEGLQAAAFAAPDIGTATPFSNEASILSYPDPEGGNAAPDEAETARLARLARRLHHGVAVEVPTGVGFCLYIRRACLADAGLFREDLFAQGYGEENDFCIRAHHLGWRHVAAPGVFVTHLGGGSFGAAAAWLTRRNLGLLNRLHPGYHALIVAHVAADPLFAHRRRLDAERFAAGREAAGAAILITHGRGGGVDHFVRGRAAALREAGLRPILLRPAASPSGRAALVSDEATGEFPNLRFDVPAELGPLVRLLRPERVLHAELHDLVGHDHAILELCRLLAVPYDAYLHDYAAFCGRIALVGREGRYCGEPELEVCAACIADAGSEIEEEIAPTALIARSAAELKGARRVIAPSADAAGRYRRRFQALQIEVEPWENDAALPASVRRGFREKLSVAVIGAISIAKGYEILLAAARDAAWRALPLRFVLVGYSCDDRRLLETGRVFATGEYRAEELPALIAAERADFAFLPSVWPETWCFALSEAWRAGLDVVSFDLGAQAERIRATGRGWVLPLGLTPAALNNAFFNLGAPARR